MGRIKDLAQKLKGRKRIFLWGAMGVGKSTLALELARWFGRHHSGGRILALDPGSAGFQPSGLEGTNEWGYTFNELIEHFGLGYETLWNSNSSMPSTIQRSAVYLPLNGQLVL